MMNRVVVLIVGADCEIIISYCWETFFYFHKKDNYILTYEHFPLIHLYTYKHFLNNLFHDHLLIYNILNMFFLNMYA